MGHLKLKGSRQVHEVDTITGQRIFELWKDDRVLGTQKLFTDRIGFEKSSIDYIDITEEPSAIPSESRYSDFRRRTDEEQQRMNLTLDQTRTNLERLGLLKKKLLAKFSA